MPPGFKGPNNVNCQNTIGLFLCAVTRVTFRSYHKAFYFLVKSDNDCKKKMFWNHIHFRPKFHFKSAQTSFDCSQVLTIKTQFWVDTICNSIWNGKHRDWLGLQKAGGGEGQQRNYPSPSWPRYPLRGAMGCFRHYRWLLHPSSPTSTWHLQEGQGEVRGTSQPPHEKPGKARLVVESQGFGLEGTLKTSSSNSLTENHERFPLKEVASFPLARVFLITQ